MKNKVVLMDQMELLSLSSPNIAARLAQLVEHQTFNLRVMGSNPISGSTKCASSFSNFLNSKLEKKWCRPAGTYRISAEIAQLGERQTEDLQVPRSIPAFGNTVQYG